MELLMRMMMKKLMLFEVDYANPVRMRYLIDVIHLPTLNQSLVSLYLHLFTVSYSSF